MIDWTTTISIALTPITGVISYYAGSKKRKNDFLQELQSSIDLLSTKNSELMEKLLAVQEQNLSLSIEVKMLRKENETLNKRIKIFTEQLKKHGLIDKSDEG